MVIAYYGISCFKIQSGDTVLAIDPFDKSSGLTPPRFQTDIVLSSHNHPNHNNIDSLAPKQESGIFAITTPGEYEIHGIQIRGIPSWHDAKSGAEKGKNTIYVIEWENMRVVHMGDYGEHELRDELHETIGTPDILMLPIGGRDTIDEETAVKLIAHIEPRIIIPMHYKIPGVTTKWSDVEEFLKEMGEKTAPEERFTIKKKDVPAENQRIVVLKTP